MSGVVYPLSLSASFEQRLVKTGRSSEVAHLVETVTNYNLSINVCASFLKYCKISCVFTYFACSRYSSSSGFVLTNGEP